MAGIITNDIHGPTATDHLALITNSFNAGSDFHRTQTLTRIYWIIRNDPV